MKPDPSIYCLIHSPSLSPDEYRPRHVCKKCGVQTKFCRGCLDLHECGNPDRIIIQKPKLERQSGYYQEFAQSIANEFKESRVAQIEKIEEEMKKYKENHNTLKLKNQTISEEKG